jgi:hypothetical protein
MAATSWTAPCARTRRSPPPCASARRRCSWSASSVAFVVEDAQTVEEADRPPSLTFLMGKALNALTLDPLERDLKAVERYNALFRWGVETYGPDFMEKLNAQLRPEPGTEYRAVRTALILPRGQLRPPRRPGVSG